MKTIKKIIHFKLTLAVFLLLPVIVVTLITSKTDMLMGIQSFVVQSGSMNPSIPVGAVVYMQSANQYHANDVIAFKTASDQIVTHRVAGVGKNSKGEILYKTKGDANKEIDGELVPANKVIGKNIFILPYLGYAINAVQTPTGFILSIIVPTLLFIGFELWNIKKEIEKSVERRVRESLQTA